MTCMSPKYTFMPYVLQLGHTHISLLPLVENKHLQLIGITHSSYRIGVCTFTVLTVVVRTWAFVLLMPVLLEPLFFQPLC